MKKIIFILVLIATSAVAFSQKKTQTHTAVSAVGGTVIGTYKDAFSINTGAFLDQLLTVTSSVSYTLTAGYLISIGKNGSDNASQIPVMAGVQYKACKNGYLGASSGVSFFTKGEKYAQFIIAPYIGYKFNKVALEARYYNTSTSNKSVQSVNLGFVYNFK